MARRRLPPRRLGGRRRCRAHHRPDDRSGRRPRGRDDWTLDAVPVV